MAKSLVEIMIFSYFWKIWKEPVKQENQNVLPILKMSK